MLLLAVWTISLIGWLMFFVLWAVTLYKALKHDELMPMRYSVGMCSCSALMLITLALMRLC